MERCEGFDARIRSDLSHHGGDYFVSINHMPIGDRGVRSWEPVDPELVVPPSAEHDVRKRQLLSHRLMKHEITDASVLMRPEGRLLAQQVRSAEVHREFRRDKGAKEIGRYNLERTICEGIRAERVRALGARARLQQLCKGGRWARQRRPVVSSCPTARVGLGVSWDPAAPRHHAIVIVRPPHALHHLQVALDSGEVHERVIVSLAEPGCVILPRRVLPPGERLLGDGVGHPIACLHKDDVRVHLHLKPHSPSLRAAHAVPTTEHEEDRYASARGLGDSQVLADPDSTVPVGWGRDDPDHQLITATR